jgi:hypothetical protein
MRFFVVDEPLVFHLLWNKTFLQAGKLLAVKRRLIWKRYALFEWLTLPRCWGSLHTADSRSQKGIEENRPLHSAPKEDSL